MSRSSQAINRLAAIRGLTSCLVLWLGAGNAALRAEESISTPAKDMYCGPRAVQRVLRWHDIDEELIVLIREAQWPELEQGAPLDRLLECLSGRGVQARTISLPARSRLTWDGPVLIHVALADGGGHYVAASSVSAGETLAYSGIQETMFLNDLTASARATVILTSREPISDRAIAAATARPDRVVWFSLCVALGALLLLLSLRTRLVRGAAPISTPVPLSLENSDVRVQST